MIKNFLLLAVTALSLNFVATNTTNANGNPDEILDNLLVNTPIVREVDQYGSNNYGKVERGNRPNNALCEVNTFYLDEPSIVRFKLSNSADDGIVYYRIYDEETQRDKFGPFEADKVTFILDAGRYSLKTNLLAIKSKASAKYKSNIYSVPVPVSHKHPAFSLEYARRINLDDSIVQYFASGSDEEQAHYYKFKLNQRQKITIYASQTDYLGDCSIQILDTDGNELADPLYFDSDNLINKTYTASEGEYIVKVSPTSDRGSAYFFMVN